MFLNLPTVSSCCRDEGNGTDELLFYEKHASMIGGKITTHRLFALWVYFHSRVSAYSFCFCLIEGFRPKATGNWALGCARRERKTIPGMCCDRKT